jgi:hypothetical protein
VGIDGGRSQLLHVRLSGAGDQELGGVAGCFSFVSQCFIIFGLLNRFSLQHSGCFTVFLGLLEGSLSRD